LWDEVFVRGREVMGMMKVRVRVRVRV